MVRLTLKALEQQLRDGTLDVAAQRALHQDPRVSVQRLLARLAAAQESQRDEQVRLAFMLTHEKALWDEGLTWVAGVDEAGAGPLAGPVFAAAVVLPPGTSIVDIDDSKRLTRLQRERLALAIRAAACAVAVASCSAAEIDRLNIYQAAREAMRRAVCALPKVPQHLLVDARRVPSVRMDQTPLVKGDSRSQSIAAAGILAKVARDAAMASLALRYPGYGFEQHQGYATLAHQAALARLGPCPEHRRSFAPVSALGPLFARGASA